MIRLGVDWGGTKLEVIALSAEGQTLLRKRVSTPRDDYHACITAVRDLVLNAEAEVGETCSVGMGIPGTISPASGLVKNANSTWLNGKPLLQDMQKVLNRDVRIQNDANCFAVSESVDGAGEAERVVVGVILGTGCGAGIAVDGKALVGRGGIAGEFGHTPLAPMNENEFPGNACWCGKRGCLETYISGTGFQRTYESIIGEPSHMTAEEILDLKDENSQRAYENYCGQLARGLAQIINILDPDVIVLGGGMSNMKSLYDDVPLLMTPYVFTDYFDTPIVPAKHGDSSGVRGAAWLW